MAYQPRYKRTRLPESQLPLRVPNVQLFPLGPMQSGLGCQLACTLQDLSRGRWR